MPADNAKLGGLTRQEIEMMGMPHIGAEFIGGDIHRYHSTVTTCRCCCMRRSSNVHHIVPLSRVNYYAHETDNGLYVLTTPLIALCGSGTTGCHGRFHRREYSIRWVWDNKQAQKDFWSGELFEHYSMHDKKLFEVGHWEIKNNKTGGIHAIFEEHTHDIWERHNAWER